MPDYILSKSTYIRALQCTKSLYLNKFRPYLRDKLSEEQLAKFARGHVVGKVAQQLFPGGIEVPRPGKSSALKTQKLIEDGATILYEACFIHNEVIIAIDILIKDQKGWNAYEVKSSYVLSETYYNDAALQYGVIVGSGIELISFNLVNRNPELEIPMDVFDPQGYIFTNVTEFCSSQTSEIESRVQNYKEVLTLEKSPAIQPGLQCMKPYPCDFRGVCWKKLTTDQQNELLNTNC